MARLTAAYYAGSIFPFHHTPSRFVCMIACGDRYVFACTHECQHVLLLLLFMWRSKGEVREEGRKGLVRPAEDNVMEWNEKERQFPDFCSMLQYLCKRVSLSP